MQFMTIDAVAKSLAVHRSTVERIIKSGQLQAIKVNNSVRILEDSFNEFIRRNAISNFTQEEKQDNSLSNNYTESSKKATLRSMMKHFGVISGSKEECDKIVRLIQKSKIPAEF